VLERVRRLSAALGIASPDFGDEVLRDAAAAGRRPFVITLGNKKGGTGKSTTAIHLVVALLQLGHRVGSIDLDGGQGTLSRYLANRRAAAESGGPGSAEGGFAEASGPIVMPEHRRVEPSQAASRDAAEREERGRLRQALADLAPCDFVVVDTPGSDSYLSRLGHANADLLITPLNDSFLDLDILAEIDRDRREVVAPSAYCRMVWEQRDRRAAQGGGLDWIVMRNRLAHIDARNNREIADLLMLLSKRIGFRMEHGLSERVVFRELFFKGLTLLDLPEDNADARSSSRRHARREVSDLVQALGVLKPAAS
jgi:chromosome partitioning protein